MRRLPSIDIGVRLGKLTVIRDLGIGEDGHSTCEVRCDCGTVKAVKTAEVVSGHVRTCGCGLWSAKARAVEFDLIGKTFGRLTVVKLTGRDSKKYRTCLAKCSCGTEKVVRICKVVSGELRSCGCLLDEYRNKALPKLAKVSHYMKHGLHGNITYNSWMGMVQRCFNKHRHNYADYGGRGIIPCQFLKQSPLNLVSTIGHRPSRDFSLDRIDNNRGYTCGQCDECKEKGWSLNIRWATDVTQCRNRRSNARFTIAGVSKTVVEWSHEMKLPYRKVWDFLRRYATAQS